MTRLAIVESQKPSFHVDQIRIATPCHASWDDMHGDERVRFCGACRKNVYTLDGMARAEIRQLFEETEGTACVRLYRRADGTVLTADCPVGLAAKARAALRKTWAMSVFLVVTLATAALALVFNRPKPGCAVDVHTMGAPTPPPVEVMREVAEPPVRKMGKMSPPERPTAHDMGGVSLDGFLEANGAAR